ncbi:TonB-dependent receptor [Sphingobium sp. HWE2-09]|uniref:TonB-dependent receptor n=1 Tax=Sphingobium sp. HWE2-09 TaxID=3108390 RepID=UPI002DC30AB7|nr:TonB-dependent receptor [Sphingobium sp. HWE2-09]
MRLHICLMLSVSMVGLGAASAAFGQDSTSAVGGTSASQQSDGRTLVDIIVTAERRTSTEQKTAASISTRSGEDLSRQGRYSLANILDNVPGVLGGAAESPGGSNTGATDNPASGLTIRGIQSNVGTGGSVTSTAAAAAIYVDGVYNGIGGSYDIERVEVLRGPQGTLYGRSATSGVVAIHTRNPDLTKFGVDLLGQVGNYNLTQISGAVNIPLVDGKLALRVAGNRYSKDGYYSAIGGYRRSSEGRAKLLFTPSDTFSALLGVAIQDNVANVGGVSITQPTPDNFTSVKTDYGTGTNKFRQYWGEFNLDLGGVNLVYLPSYKTWTQNTLGVSRGNVPEFNQTFQTPTDKFLTQELRINSHNDSALSWQAGLFYYNNRLKDLNELRFYPTNALAFRSASSKKTQNIGVFGEATYALSDSTRLTGGLRYDYTRVRNNQVYTSITGNTGYLIGDEGLRTFKNVTYKARLEHDLTPVNLIYASVSTGFSPGDVAIATDITGNPSPVDLQAQTLTSYEIGSKNRFLGNRLQVNVAAYYNDYGGYQTAGINLTPQTPMNPTFNTVTSPVRVYGGELEMLARPWQDGQVGVNLSYNHARYHDIPAQFQYLFWTNKIPGTVPFQANGWLEQGVELQDQTRLSLRGELLYRSAYYASRLTVAEAMVSGPGALNSKPYAYNSGKLLGNLSATLSFEDGRYTLTGYVRNVGDVRYKTGARRTAAFGPVAGTSTVDLSDPRTFGITAAVRL